MSKKDTRFSSENLLKVILDPLERMNKVFRRELEWMDVEETLSGRIGKSGLLLSEENVNPLVKGSDKKGVMKAELWARILYRHNLVRIAPNGKAVSLSSKTDNLIFEIWQLYFKNKMGWPTFAAKDKIRLTRKVKNIKDTSYRLKSSAFPENHISILDKIQKAYQNKDTLDKPCPIPISALSKVVFILARYGILHNPIKEPYKVIGNPDDIYSVWQLYFKTTSQWNDFAQRFIFQDKKRLVNLPKKKIKKPLTSSIITDIESLSL